MIDPTLRLDHLARAAADPETAVILLDVVLAQLDPPLGSLFRPFAWMRPLRNHPQYPAPEHPVAQPEDVVEALPATTTRIDAAARILDQMPTY